MLLYHNKILYLLVQLLPCRLEQELERVLEQLVAGMQQRQSALQQQLVAAKGQQQELQVDL